ncbi:hypothetical protein GCM10009554_77850 [Kribbella koreensis]|uniref:Uncharacterized protein n=1 Tax=Kribbella koreensis TaxID=57909 RepID=A0ABN1RQ03_9ACTN
MPSGDAAPRQSASVSPEKPVPPKWEVAYSSKSVDSSFFSVAVTASEVWALGAQDPSGVRPGRELLMRLRDGKWEPVALPPAYAGTTDLSNVQFAAAPDSNDVWLYAAVKSKPYAWRWDGSRWLAAPGAISPLAVLVLAPDDIWAVDSFGAVVRHWNGRRWNDAGLKNFQATTFSTVAPDDIWAVGATVTAGVLQPAARHFDGRTWRTVPVRPYHFKTKSLESESTSLTKVVAVGPDDVWAVGSHTGSAGIAEDNPPEEKIVLHWTGDRWEEAPKSLHSWTLGVDGEGGVILPDISTQRTADGQLRRIGPPQLLPGPTGKLTPADRAQKPSVSALSPDPRTKTIWAVGYVGISAYDATSPSKGPFYQRAVILRFNPGKL